jgi:N-acetylmuramoyl-L-alanine amidase
MKYCLLFGIIFSLFSFSVKAAEIQGIPERIDGKDRFDVATNISKNWDQADYVVIVNYLAYADALTAAPLAYKYNAPILLSHYTNLDASINVELERLKVKRVLVVGGPGSVSDKVIEALKRNGRIVERIGGKDRFEVALNIANKFRITNEMIVANGYAFPDALTVAPYASKNAIPILLTNSNSLPANIGEYTKKNSISKTWVIGGEGSVSPIVYKKLPYPSRIGGKDRYEVAANIARSFGNGNKKFFLATGMSFADALTGSVLAAKQNGNILLTSNKALPEATLSVLKQNNRFVTILGGTGSVGDEIVASLKALHSSNRPILYFVPHQDDEILSMGVDIRNQLSRGRNIQVILVTDGENSEARDILNGQYDNESKDPSKAGRPLKDTWHDTIHDPRLENFQHGYLSFEEFTNLRTNEFYRALETLGVSRDRIHIEGLHAGNINKASIEEIIKKYISTYPNADIKSLSWFDGHPTHSLIGQSIKDLQDNKIIKPYQAEFFLSIYTDRFYSIPKPMKTQKILFDKESERSMLINAANVYKRYDPANGFYAIGYHSVPSQFAALTIDPYTNFHF